MPSIAIMISGRLTGYETGLIPFLNILKRDHDIKVFFSINTISLENVDVLKDSLQTHLGELIGGLNFEDFKLPKKFVDERMNSSIMYDDNKFVNNKFSYNELSQSYNNKKNFEMICAYPKKFNIICKCRTDIIFTDIGNFIVDDPDKLTIRHKHIINITHWGYRNTPPMISDIFAYGNMKSMTLYCSVYDWILLQHTLMNGEYVNGMEIYLTDAIFKYVFYNTPGGGKHPRLTPDEIKTIYERVNIIISDQKYSLMSPEIRHKNNFTVNLNNIEQYTESVITESVITEMK